MPCPIAGDTERASAMGSQRSKSIAARVATLALPIALPVIATLGGCGGGGNDSAPTSSAARGTPATTSTPAPASNDSVLHAACSSCSAADDSTYTGSGTAVWQAVNTNASAIDVPVSIKGLSGQNMTLVFTNEGTSAQPMPAIALSTSSANMSASIMRAQPLSAATAMATAMATATTASGENPTLAAIRDFNYRGWAALATNRVAPAARYSTNGASTTTYNVGDTRTFYYADYSPRTTTLAQTTNTSDGTTVNLWVESAELGAAKISPQIIGTAVVYDARGVFELEGISREQALSLQNQQVKIHGTITRVNNADAQHVQLPAVRVESLDIVQSPDATSSSSAPPAR
ncbi:hypothetical protein VSR68_26445 [Paraburkholderia phymatum]|uniref:M30 family zinc metallopeptidase n=1 Tax=Paraburkholderia phymatum TaxID=148447 RepID=UPI00316CD806